jgi:DeoR family transcriptional regulator, fructose operon transcriptional repressor
MGVSPIANNRHMTILEHLEHSGRVRVDELAENLNVSSVTIRRDLDYLNERGHLVRTHGGAARVPEGLVSASERRFADKGTINVAEKTRIAERAAEMIVPHDTVFLNSGSTAIFFLRALRDRAARVITNNAAAIECEVDPLVELLILGGEYREQSRSFVGEFALNTIRNIYSTHTILGTNGISLDQGLTTTVYQECNINQAMIENTHGKVIVLADNSKIGQVANFVSASLEAIDMVITDTGAPEEFVRELRSRGIEVLVV